MEIQVFILALLAASSCAKFLPETKHVCSFSGMCGDGYCCKFSSGCYCSHYQCRELCSHGDLITGNPTNLAPVQEDTVHKTVSATNKGNNNNFDDDVRQAKSYLDDDMNKKLYMIASPGGANVVPLAQASIPQVVQIPASQPQESKSSVSESSIIY